MSEKLKLEPTHLSPATEDTDVDRWWFYEENGGLCVVHEAEATTQQAMIPLRVIRAYMKRRFPDDS